MRILVLNCGSSSLKFQLIEKGSDQNHGVGERKLARGLIDDFGEKSVCKFAWEGAAPSHRTAYVKDHAEAVQTVVSWISDQPGGTPNDIDAVGHRVVHGGERFADAVLIDDNVLGAIENLTDLAPLHNPACVSGIRAARRELGSSVPMVAVFDTSFHHTLPQYAATYAIPLELSERHRIRRYGFHGLAHRSTMLRYAELTKTPSDCLKVIALHLGNGCSATAIRGGRSVDTSMGFTPLEGLMMGTRCGDIDPSVLVYLSKREGVLADEVENWLNNRSGLFGISGDSNDMRRVLELARLREDPRAKLAVQMFCYRARKYLGAYLAVLGGADAVIFSGGIGENSPEIRERICSEMEWCGLKLELKQNADLVGSEGLFSSADSQIKAFVIPADEELLIARDSAALVSKSQRSP